MPSGRETDSHGPWPMLQSSPVRLAALRLERLVFGPGCATVTKLVAAERRSSAVRWRGIEGGSHQSGQLAWGVPSS